MSPATEAALVLAGLLALTNVPFWLPRRYEERLGRWQLLHPILAGILRYLAYIAVAVCAIAMLALAFNPNAFAATGRIVAPRVDSDCASFERFARQVALIRIGTSMTEEILWEQVTRAAGPDLTPAEALLSRLIISRIYDGQAPRPSWWGC